MATTKQRTTKKSKDVKDVKVASTSARKSVPFITRHRPFRFKDLIGMDQVASSLSKSIADGEIPNAFILLGSTGCGKTTVSRIIARTVMCETGTACGKCESCKLADTGDLGNHIDYFELNCGTCGKIDDIRGVISLSTQRPMVGRMRVILLDEVHRLTPQAAEALLKPLEEPSEQTLWILATSEASNIKQTIKNRCQFIPIRPVAADILGHYLSDLSADYWDLDTKNRVKLSEEIANVAGGYIRDALTLMDSTIKMYNSGSRSSDDFDDFFKEVQSKILGSADVDVTSAQQLVLATILGNSKRIVEILADHSDFVALSRNCVQFTQYLLDRVYNVRGVNVYHPPAFRDGNDSLVSLLKKRDRYSVARLTKVLTIMIMGVTDMHSRIMTFSVPERALISSHLLKLLVEIRPLTKTAKDDN